MLFNRSPGRSLSLCLRQRGVATWAVLVGLGVLAVGAAFVLTSDRSQLPEVATEVSNIRQLSQGLQVGYPGKDYRELTVEGAIRKRLVPGPMFRGGGQSIRSAWGTPIQMAPHTVLRSADGFVITYQSVPAQACEQLSRALGGEVYELKVSGKTVLAPDGWDGSAAEQHCARSEGATMEFVYHPELIPQTGVLR